MPHMANLPWIPFYLLIALTLTFFWTKENFSVISNFTKKEQMSKITKSSLNWT
uniref:ATPase subunit 8 n=1 Tax=Hypsibius dujardini TaxID=232323 RepID=E7BBA8_HYPDU|nr:ATP synthase F0 subunit 8 [Hypsibius dujardini]CBY83889.1 ATPase subunit 8 [Hypsibius dujardini]